MIRIDHLRIQLPACLGRHPREFADHFARELARIPVQSSTCMASLQVRGVHLGAPDALSAAKAAAAQVRQSIDGNEHERHD